MKIKLLVLCLGLLIGGFLFAQKSLAADTEVYSQNSGGTNFQVWNSYNFPETYFATSTNFNSNGKISQLKLTLKVQNHGSLESCGIGAYIIDSSGTKYYSTTNTTFAELGTAYSEYTFAFASTSTISLSSNTLKGVGFNPGAGCASIYNWVDAEILSPYSSSELSSSSQTGLGTSWALKFSLFVDNACAIGQNCITWQNPPMSNNFTSPDFLNWLVCPNLQTGQSGNSIGHFYKIYYGTSTTTMTNLDNSFLTFGYYPTNSIPYNTCEPVIKSQSLATGTYYSVIELYTHSYFGGDTFVASSTILKFNIVSGTTGTYPNQSVALPTQNCGPTDFNIDFGVGSVDFGLGLCKTARFLFYPPDGVSNLFSRLSEENKTKIPISYFYEMKAIVDSVGSGTPASLPAVKIQTSATSSIPNLNIEIFSTSTIAAATSRGGFSGLRTVANVVLWVAWGFLMLQTGLHLFKRKEM